MIEEVDPNKPKLIEYVRSPMDIDWTRPLREQMKPRLWVQPNPKLTPSELHELRRINPRLSEEDFHDIMRNNAHGGLTC